jgi:hypothetical protein
VPKLTHELYSERAREYAKNARERVVTVVFGTVYHSSKLFQQTPNVSKEDSTTKTMRNRHNCFLFDDTPTRKCILLSHDVAHFYLLGEGRWRQILSLLFEMSSMITSWMSIESDNVVWSMLCHCETHPLSRIHEVGGTTDPGDKSQHWMLEDQSFPQGRA